MIRLPAMLAAAMILFPATLPAQSVDEVLGKHFDALGGLTKLKAAKSMRITGRMTLGQGIEAGFVRLSQRPNMSRLDFTVQGVTGTQAYDGQTAWMHMPFMGQAAPEVMPADLAKSAAEEAEFDGPLLDHVSKGHTVELIGKQTVEGTETFELKLTRKSGEVTMYYLDAEYYLPLKVEAKRTIQGREMTFVTSYGDYKDVEGLMMPHSMTITGQGPGAQVLTIEKVELNLPMDAAQFKMPTTGAPKDGAL